MEVTAANLGAINNALDLAYNSQLTTAESVQKRFADQRTSVGRTSVYPRLDELGGMNEWFGARQAEWLSQSEITITNRKFEKTINISHDDIEDDRYGIYTPVAQQMGTIAARQPDMLIAQALEAATTTLTYDGEPFFSSNHVGYTATGATTAVSNYNNAAQGPAWYLFYDKMPLKALILQTRRPFQIRAQFDLNNPRVFESDVFQWGTDGRLAAGLGIWQFAYCSTATLNTTNLLAARAAMASLRRPDGNPMGIVPTLFVSGVSLFPLANSIYKNQLIASDPSSPTTLIDNRAVNMFEPIEFPWIP